MTTVESAVQTPVTDSARATAPARAPRAWLPALDGMRAVAALAVLVTHVSFRSGVTTGDNQIGGLTARLEVGVALFFVLSGYLLYRPYAAAAINRTRSPRTGTYLRKRALRILPAYWLMMIPVLIAFNAGYTKDWQHWVVPLALGQIYQPLWLPIGAEQTWSLCTELSFYLALPLLVLLGRLLGGRTPGRRFVRQLLLVGLLIVVGVGWTTMAHQPWWPLNATSTMWLPGYLDWFGLGMGMAVLAAAPEVRSRLRPLVDSLATAPWTCWAVGAALLWIASTPLLGPRAVFPAATAAESVGKHILYAVTAGFFVLPLVGGGEPAPTVRYLLENPVARYLGKISYGLFLWHLPILAGCLRYTDTPEFSGHFWVLLLATVGLSVVAASLSYHLVERPLQRLR
jgi:peptidoglycan/LPS O-acetylase OafA/YrhL